MNGFFDKDGVNINAQHKTWTPDDRIKYEKTMAFFRIKIAAAMVGGCLLLFSLFILLSKLF